MSYTLGESYTTEYWTQLAKQIEEEGSDSICIKDMAGLLLPYTAGELVKALNALGATPRDLISIFSALKRAGALHADLVIM